MLQTWRLAMAIHPEDHARPCGAPLVGRGRGHVVDDACGQCLGGGAPPEGRDVPDLRPLLGAIVATPSRPRRLRLLRLDWLWCLVWQITTGGLPLPQRFVPEPWPDIPMGVLVVTFHQHALQYKEI